LFVGIDGAVALGLGLVVAGGFVVDTVVLGAVGLLVAAGVEVLVAGAVFCS
jgi:hypothetical protein